MATKQAQWIHMVGIGGAGMSGIARILCEQGYKVSGSDLQYNSISTKLEEMGVKIYTGHSSSYLQEGVDVLVVSSAIPEDNVELQVAKHRNIPILKRGQMLAALANKKKGIAVAGSHGKTTTTAMMYTSMEKCGLSPSFIVGGELLGNALNARQGQGDLFIVEADESDASFLELQPHIAVVTNIENDHLDFYKSVDRIEHAFLQFLNQVDPEGFSLLYGEDPFVQSIQNQIRGNSMLFGADPAFAYSLADWRASGMGSVFDVYHYGELMGEAFLRVPGYHNALNALAVIGVGSELGLSFDRIRESLQEFNGAKRRFELLGKVKGTTVVDDYAHHPTEIRASLHAARAATAGKVAVVFQPHRYTRTQLLARDFGAAFKDADQVIITDVFPAGEKPIPGVSGKTIYEEARKNDCNVRYIEKLEDVESFLRSAIIKGEIDLLMTMGAGDIYKLGLRLVEPSYVPQV